KGMNTLADAGRGLAELVTMAQPSPGLVYSSLRKGQLTWPQPSELALNDAAATALWLDSARLTGIG
ncbi:hypothetical protein, partial [Novosphingobium sp.]|uniref:hypothetical protein n=1 Tax=Novosphingobium sp. TaxID=1874826 RepID=UPI00260BD128